MGVSKQIIQNEDIVLVLAMKQILTFFTFLAKQIRCKTFLVKKPTESKAVPTQKIKQDEKVDYGMKNTGKLHGGFRQEVYHCNTTGNEFINEGDVYGEVLQNLWGCDSGFKFLLNQRHSASNENNNGYDELESNEKNKSQRDSDDKHSNQNSNEDKNNQDNSGESWGDSSENKYDDSWSWNDDDDFELTFNVVTRSPARSTLRTTRYLSFFPRVAAGDLKKEAATQKTPDKAWP